MTSNSTILITGGTGMIGTRLTQLLQVKNYNIRYLSRSQKNIPGVEVFTWDIDKGEIEEKALERADYIVHLAGEGVANKKWSALQKKNIFKSRTASAELLYHTLAKMEAKPKAFISASGISIYGSDRQEELLGEESTPANDFLAQVAKAWEEQAEKISSLGIRVVKYRIGIVLSDKGGAFPKLMKPINLGAGAALGTGKQYMSWLHIDDMCHLIIKAIEEPNLQGVYNAVAPQPVRNKEFMKDAAELAGKPFFLPNIPAFALKMVLGELSQTVLGSLNVSSKKIQQANFTFLFPNHKDAIKDLL